LSLWLYVVVSAIGGLLVGALGTGSTLIVLPSLALAFGTLVTSGASLRLAAGTTMAVVSVGAIAGAFAQYRARQVDMRLFRLTLLPYAAGALTGPWLSRALPTRILGAYVSVLICIVALRMLFPRRARSDPRIRYDSRRWLVGVVLTLIGIGCSIAGISSGIFAIPYLSRFTASVRTAIGTSTASAAVYSVFATVGYVTAGWTEPDLPEGHFGFVYMPAFIVMGATALIVTPIGVKLAARLNERLLRRLFGVFLLVAAIAIALTK
jgi:uncharacterized protein